MLRSLMGNFGCWLIDRAMAGETHEEPPAETSMDEQVQRIVEKDELHKFLDGLDEYDTVLLLREAEDGSHCFRTFGNPTFAHMLWMTEIFRQWLCSVNT